MSDKSKQIGFVNGNTRCDHEFIWHGSKHGVDEFRCQFCDEYFEQFTDVGSGG